MVKEKILHTIVAFYFGNIAWFGASFSAAGWGVSKLIGHQWSVAKTVKEWSNFNMRAGLVLRILHITMLCALIHHPSSLANTKQRYLSPEATIKRYTETINFHVESKSSESYTAGYCCLTYHLPFWRSALAHGRMHGELRDNWRSPCGDPGGWVTLPWQPRLTSVVHRVVGMKNQSTRSM